ncbi:Monovalent Cation:Proton Antiporter-1 (CPA1) Family [Achlya hypogyna]|uniref:Sodium/hydrogen exchanger n=1 Tax=Achlya hypogyna TaxID=1202772 RepID=A0A1V9ZG65_ACHHY|nr:Monovalent Cation:Proton Antiporter-1 (CPA1) Family [Achlya hypogyna]
MGEATTEHEVGMESQKEFAIYFFISLTIIMLAILFSNYVAHHRHWFMLPEAAATILVGMLGGVLYLMHTSSVTQSLATFDPSIFFVGLLPPIIFNSGYTMKRRYFFDNITAIITYAVAGTTISSFVVGVICYTAGYAGISLKLTLAEALSFGALISATDTVSVLAIFQELRVEPTLFYLVFGESSLNDAVAIVLFASFSKFIGNSFTASAIPLAIIDFIFIFAGSTLVGILFGMLSALLFKHYDFKGCLFHEVAVYVMFSYLPFSVCTVFDLSGVVAILFTGIAMKHYTCNNLTEEGKATCAKFFNAISYVSEATIFLNLGLAVFSMQEGFHFSFAFWTLFACLLGRALHVYPLSYLINRRKTPERQIPKATQHMLWFSGLRGALCFALALEWPNELQRHSIINVTMVVVLVTLFIGGGATVPVLNYLNIKRLTPSEEQAVDQMVRPLKRMRILQFDAQYLVPFLTHMHPPADADGQTNAKAEAQELTELRPAAATPELVAALQGLDKPSQKLLRNVVHLQPVQNLLLTFLQDSSRSFEDWIWDPKTREVLGRMEAMVDPASVAPTTAHSALNRYFHDALAHQRDARDLDGLLEAAEAEKARAKEWFVKKQFNAAMMSYKKIADALKPHLFEREDFTDSYVACCSNVAICAVKERRWPLVRDYAHATLAVKKDYAKAWYCLAKLYVHEQCFNDALDAVQQAISLNPTDPALLKLQAEIPVIAAKIAAEIEAEQVIFKERHAQLQEAAAAEAARLEAERSKPPVIKLVALPQPHATLPAVSALNVYFQRSKQVLGVESQKITDGPPPRFQCTLTNVTQGDEVLGQGEGNSKQEAKEAAAQAASLRMWQDRAKADAFHEDDRVFLAANPHILHTWSLSPPGEAPPDVAKTYTCAIFPSRNDKMQMPNMLLNQYTTQGKMHFEYKIEDFSKPEASDFQVSGVLNGRCVATARDVSKKRAKLAVAKESLEIAFRESREMFPDQRDPLEHD